MQQSESGRTTEESVQNTRRPEQSQEVRSTLSLDAWLIDDAAPRLRQLVIAVKLQKTPVAALMATFVALVNKISRNLPRDAAGPQSHYKHLWQALEDTAVEYGEWERLNQIYSSSDDMRGKTQQLLALARETTNTSSWSEIGCLNRIGREESLIQYGERLVNSHCRAMDSAIKGIALPDDLVIQRWLHGERRQRFEATPPGKPDPLVGVPPHQ